MSQFDYGKFMKQDARLERLEDEAARKRDVDVLSLFISGVKYDNDIRNEYLGRKIFEMEEKIRKLQGLPETELPL